MHRTTLLFLVLLGLATAPAAVAGQVSCASMAQCAPMHFDPGLRQELAVVGANALLGGMTAATARALRGEPFWSSFWTGAVGGGVVYAGKRIAVEDFAGAGLVGREVASVGGSMVRNAASGRAALQELVLPVGPVRLYISRQGVVPRVDVATVVAASAFMLYYDARLDLGQSLSAGALIFRGTGPMPGLSSAGAVMVWDDMPAHEGPRLLAHERVHILQYDQAFLSWGERPENRITDLVPDRWSGGLFGYLDTGAVVLAGRSALSALLPYAHRPWEAEAYLMAELAHPIP